MTDTAKTKSAISRSEPKLNRKPPSSRLSEATVWQPIRDGWRQLYGGFYDLGVSIEWQEFELPHAFEWSRSFHPDSLELCLNLAGHGPVRCADKRLGFEPLTAGFYLPGGRALQAWRDAGQQHRFITMEFSPRFLRRALAQVRRRACTHWSRSLCAAMAVPAPAWVKSTGSPPRRNNGLPICCNPPVLQGARPLWYQGKVLEIMAEFFFERRGEDELFCDRQKRLARERVDRVVALLRKNLVEPLSLEEIGREVGCSPFHLSRTFSRRRG